MRTESARFMMEFPEQIASNLRFAVIGCGAVGSRVIDTLARMGCGRFVVWDNDTVEAENVGVQLFDLSDVHKHKVEAMSVRVYRVMTKHVHFVPITKKFTFRTRLPTVDVVIASVDSIDVRKIVFRAYLRMCKRSAATRTLFVDPRMGLYYCEVHALSHGDKQTPHGAIARYLRTTNFKAVRAPCGRESTPTTAAACAAMTVQTILNWATGKEYSPWWGFNLLTGDTTVSPPYDGTALPPDPYARKARQAAKALQRLHDYEQAALGINHRAALKEAGDGEEGKESEERKQDPKQAIA